MGVRSTFVLFLVAASLRADGESLSLAERTGSWFAKPPDDPSASPDASVIRLPDVPGGRAIWGATGRDRRGHVWFGISVSDRGSARLYEYVPASGKIVARGDAVDQLKKAGLARPDESQAKIHSRIVQGDDGFLYFASMDDNGEDWRGDRLPAYGGHLWRLDPRKADWEHLFATKEPLIAAAAGGRWIYALGYWDHVLYQYDSRTGRHRSVRVGSTGGHVSRNIIATPDGHAFVPRVRESGAWLVELEPEGLTERAAFPLEGYLGRNPRDSHGITGFAYLADGSVAFTTGEGQLFRIHREKDGTRLAAHGDFHPSGDCYAPSLFTYEGQRYLVGAAQQQRRWRWIIYDLEKDECVERHLEFERPLKGHAFYGSVTKDSEGRFYLCGFDRNGPLLAVVDPGE